MTVEDRLDRLEQRLAVLETLMRARGPAVPGPAVPGPAVPAPALATAAVPTPTLPAASAQMPRPAFAPAAAPEGAAEPRPVASPSWSVPRFLGSEQWLGQRGLLAVGVLALILAAGYLLKLSFERGWISPAMRCAGGVLAGAAVGALGWRLLDRYRTYGASLIGCGAGIIYLAVWAAGKLYGLVPPATGITGLALLSLALAAIAYAIDVQALGAAAALGAFVAPVLLGERHANADVLLLYLGSMGVALGWVAARKRWRLAAGIIALSFFSLGWAGAAESPHPLGALGYTMLGGAGGIYLGLREGWWETRFLAFWGAWALLATVSNHLDPAWPTLVAGLALAAPVWWQALRRPEVSPLRLLARPGESGWSVGEVLYFFVTPLLLGWAVASISPDRMRSQPGLAALLVSVPYLAAGYSRARRPFALVGAAALALAALHRWPGLEAPATLLGLALLWAALDHTLGRSDGRWYAVGTLAVALFHLVDTDQPRRALDDPAFTGAWALVLWLAIAVILALAVGLWKRTPDSSGARPTRAGLWLLGGVLTLFGVTGEIERFFRLSAATPATAHLAGGLAVSAWWLVCAAALVTVGLRRGLRPARLAGLTVAGLAVLKVLIFDLSSLDALYRVASVFILGLVSLLLAYLYHRQARGAG